MCGLELSKKSFIKRYENTANKNTENESQPKRNLYLSDEQLQVLPANDEEEKEILITGKAIQATNAKRKDTLSTITKDQKHKDPNLGIMKLVQSQTKSIRDINSEIKKIQYQISQIQKRLTQKAQQQRIRSKKKK